MPNFVYPGTIGNPNGALGYPVAVDSSRLTVIVSPIGQSTPGITQLNNGADFGPDTPGTTTFGIQEALNSLPSINFTDGGNFTVPGRSGTVQLLAGVFGPITSRIVIPTGTIRFRGAGRSTWQPVLGNLGPVPTPLQDLGGTQITAAASLSNVGALACLVSSHGFPATQLDIGDMDIRMTSPGSAGSTSTPPVVDMSGWMMGQMSDFLVSEIKPGGGIGNNQYRILDLNIGANVDNKVMRNVYGVGGWAGIRISTAHLVAYGLYGGFTNGTINGFDRGIELGPNLDNFFADLHCFSTDYGLAYAPYSFAQLPFNPCVIRGIHFESCNHYIVGNTNGITGVLVIEQPIWNSTAGLVPATDIATQLANGSNTYSLSARTGIAVITNNEYDLYGFSAANRHVTPPAAALTAGASPYTFPLQPFDCTYILTTAGGISALTLDGTPVSATAGIPIFVAANHTLIATWATTAPVFQVIPK